MRRLSIDPRLLCQASNCPHNHFVWIGDHSQMQSSDRPLARSLVYSFRHLQKSFAVAQWRPSCHAGQRTRERSSASQFASLVLFLSFIVAWTLSATIVHAPAAATRTTIA